MPRDLFQEFGIQPPRDLFAERGLQIQPMAANLRGGVSTPTLEPDQGQIVAPGASQPPISNPIRARLAQHNAQFAQQQQDADLRTRASELDLQMQQSSYDDAQRDFEIVRQWVNALPPIPEGMEDQQQAAAIARDEWTRANPFPQEVADRLPPQMRQMVSDMLSGQQPGAVQYTGFQTAGQWAGQQPARIKSQATGALATLQAMNPKAQVGDFNTMQGPQAYQPQIEAVRGMADRAREEDIAAREQYAMNPGDSFGGRFIAGGGLDAVAGIAPAVLAGMAGGPLAAGAVVAGQSGGSVYQRIMEELVNQGVPEEEARQRAERGAMAAGALGAATGPLLPAGRTVASGAALGALGNVAQDVGEQEILRREAGVPGDLRQAATSLATGAAAGAGFGGAAEYRQSRAGQPRQAPPTPPEAEQLRRVQQGRGMRTTEDVQLREEDYIQPGMPDEQLARETLQEAPQPQRQPEQPVTRPPQEEQYSTQQQHPAHAGTLAHEGSVPERVKGTLPTPRSRKLSTLLRQYEDEGKIETIDDLVDEVDALGDARLSDAVETYRREQAEDYALSGRGDMDAAGEAFLGAVRSLAQGKAAVPKAEGPSSFSAAAEQLKARHARGELTDAEFGRELGKLAEQQRRPKQKPSLPTPRSRIPAQYRPEDLAEAMRGVEQRATPPRTAPEAPLVAPAEAAPTAAAVTPEPTARAPGARQPWEMTRGEYAKQQAAIPASGGFAARANSKIAKAYHRDLVTKAIAEGKPVPPEVLADYPDLAPKAPGAVTAPPETGQAPAARTFTKGDPVTWTDRGGQEHSGKVIKTAGKSVRVQMADGAKRLIQQSQIKSPPTEGARPTADTPTASPSPVARAAEAPSALKPPQPVKKAPPPPVEPPASPKAAEPAPPQTTSARKVDTTADRKAMGLDEIASPSRRSWEEALDSAKREGIPDKARRIADEVNAKPRALSDVETAGLVAAASNLKSQHKAATEQVGNATDPAEIQTAAAEANRIEDEFDQLTRALRTSGTEKGRALASQKLTLDQDNSLVSILNRAKSAKGKDLSPVERSKFEELSRNLEEANARVAKLEKRMKEQVAERAVKEAVAKKYARMKPEAREAELSGLMNKARELLKAGCH